MALKPEFFNQHTEDCKIEFRYNHEGSIDDANVYRAYFCNTHNQWCYERPVRVSYEFEDGTDFTHHR